MLLYSFRVYKLFPQRAAIDGLRGLLEAVVTRTGKYEWKASFDTDHIEHLVSLVAPAARLRSLHLIPPLLSCQGTA